MRWRGTNFNCEAFWFMVQGLQAFRQSEFLWVNVRHVHQHTLHSKWRQVMKKFISFLVALLFLASCQASFTIQPMPENLPPSNTSLPSTDPFDPTPMPLLPTHTAVIDPHSLPWSTLQNAQYHSPLWGDFQLTRGIYYRTPAEPNTSPELYSTQLHELYAYGDLNGDGAEDAVVLLQTQNGGNMSTKELAAVLNQNGQPYNISSVELGSAALEILQVQAGVIFLQGRTLGPADPLCCPSQLMVWQFQLQNGQLTGVSGPGPTPASTGTLPSAIAPSTRNNLFGLPYDSPTWLIRPRTGDHPYNILVLDVDEKCSLTINIKTDLRDLRVTTVQLVLGRHTWQRIQAFQGELQVDEIYVPDVYPPEYIEAAGSNGYGYYLSGYYDSCRLAVQGILAGMQ
jgi:hypothetical protein